MAEWTTEDVRRRILRGFTPDQPIYRQLAQQWASWLEEYTAGVRAKAVEDAADRLECAWAQQTPGSPLGTVQTVQWLRDRARAERGEA